MFQHAFEVSAERKDSSDADIQIEDDDPTYDRNKVLYHIYFL